ncbi:hypothetical protein [Acidithiobacillus sp. AMEEHan]|uniref:hypothetical protein n=1 Tax=Acidithiobacillus sp. AMEEHan TaxID=2994951 RepID=UPI0027E41F24|nr:hypothetical protein [Acidithiobacillus sp. AMEEHan]
MSGLHKRLSIPRTLAQDLLSALQVGKGNGWITRRGEDYFLYQGADQDWPALAPSLQQRGETLFARFGKVREPAGQALWRFRMAEAEKGVLTLAAEGADATPCELAIYGD